MKKWNWLDKPITWRSYLRLTTAISMLGYGIYIVVVFWYEIIDKLDEFTDLVKSKLKLG